MVIWVIRRGLNEYISRSSGWKMFYFYFEGFFGSWGYRGIFKKGLWRILNSFRVWVGRR